MTVSSISTASPTRVNPASVPPPKQPATGTQPKDADGDHDGDTSAADKGGLDVKG